MSDPKPDTDKPNSTLPAVLVAVAILAVAAVLIFWPSDDAVEGEGGGVGDQGAEFGPAGGVDGLDDGAIPARDHDPANRGRIGAAARPSPQGMLEEPRPAKIPEFQSKADEIVWYEEQRKKAQTMLDMRKRAFERLASMSPDAPNYERSRRVVEGNLEKAQNHLNEIEAHLAELRGQ